MMGFSIPLHSSMLSLFQSGDIQDSQNTKILDHFCYLFPKLASFAFQLWPVLTVACSMAPRSSTYLLNKLLQQSKRERTDYDICQR